MELDEFLVREKKANMVPIFKMERRRIQGIMTAQSDLSAWKNYGACHQALRGYQNDQEQPTWSYQEHTILDQPDLFL